MSQRTDQETIKRRDIDDILLDPENPRISAPADATQLDLLKIMFEDQSLDELALSFARNGFFTEEPVVIVPSSVNDAFVVVEGNRRVSTIKILLNGKLQKEVGATNWPRLSNAEKEALRKVPTVLYKSRADVIPYLGFRHITGIKKWEPLAKARYVAQLIENGKPISEVEESVGDNTRAVKRMYQAFVVLRQIKQDVGMDSKPIERSFSLLEVALTQAAIKQFLAMPKTLPATETKEIVSESKFTELRELVSWIFGDPSNRQDRIITDSRQIVSTLAPVIKDKDALEYLRRTRDLEGAYEFSGGEVQVLIRALRQTKKGAQRSIGLLPGNEDKKDVRQELINTKPVLDRLLEAVPADA